MRPNVIVRRNVIPQITKPLVNSVLLLVASVTLLGCSESSDPMYRMSDELGPFLQPSYTEYISETETWLKQHRYFHSSDIEKELAAVMPYELIPEKPNGHGVLLVHGLGDSPYTFVDIAPILAKQGYIVRVILLPGHGTRAADLMLPTIEDWQNVVSHHVQLLQSKVKHLWLGGFSTGTNLVTDYAARHEGVKGLLLFSPAYASKDPIVRFAAVASYITHWADKDVEQNYTRYDSLAMNGAALYYQSTQFVQNSLREAEFTLPALLLTSENDELIDSEEIATIFSTSMTNKDNRLLWFGGGEFEDPRITTYPMVLPDELIYSGSHISPLFSPLNAIYGKDGEMRRCGTIVDEQVLEKRCPEMNNIWYSAWGLFAEDKVSARLSWNPYFEESMSVMNEFMRTQNKTNLVGSQGTTN